MKVGALYAPDVVTAHPGEDLVIAASRMLFHEIGALVVYDGAGVAGIITERDVIRAMADGRHPERTIVREYMTEDPVRVAPDTDVSRAAAIMQALPARHLLVSEGSRVVGVVSARDFLALETWDEPASALARAR